MSDVLSYHHVHSIEDRDLEYLSHVKDNLLRAISLVNILKDLDEPYEDLIPLMKYLISDLVLELHTNTYINGIAEELQEAIKLRLWELSDEFKLAELINDVVELGIKVNERVVDESLARKVLSEFIDLFSLNVKNYKVLREVFKCCEPHIVLQTILVGLVIAVGGVNYSQK